MLPSRLNKFLLGCLDYSLYTNVKHITLRGSRGLLVTRLQNARDRTWPCDYIRGVKLPYGVDQKRSSLASSTVLTVLASLIVCVLFSTQRAVLLSFAQYHAF